MNGGNEAKAWITPRLMFIIYKRKSDTGGVAKANVLFLPRAAADVEPRAATGRGRRNSE
jgi:hypothetical protein